MRLNQLNLDEIVFDYTEYSDTLFNSVLRIGFSFPVKVKYQNDKYYCIDGHKRLSVLTDILKDNPSYKRGDKVTVVIDNNGDTRSNDCWRGRNTH